MSSGKGTTMIPDSVVWTARVLIVRLVVICARSMKHMSRHKLEAL